MTELDLHEKTTLVITRTSMVSVDGGAQVEGTPKAIVTCPAAVEDNTSALKRTRSGTRITRGVKVYTRNLAVVLPGDRATFSAFGQTNLALLVDSAKRYDVPGYRGQQIQLVDELRE